MPPAFPFAWPPCPPSADLPPDGAQRRRLLHGGLQGLGAGAGLLGLGLSVWPPAGAAWAQAGDGFADALRRGGCAVLVRHALTVPGTGDPPDFQLAVCSTQRNLSEEGRAQSRRLGQWFAARQLAPREVRSSQWCRCLETAELAFGRATPWPALNSTFNDRLRQPDRTAELRERLRQIPAGQFEVWVTHQVVMSALTGQYPSMGEAFAVHADARVRARQAF